MMRVDYLIFRQYKGFSRELPLSIENAWAALVQRLNTIDTGIMDAVILYTQEHWTLIDDPVPAGPLILVGPCCDNHGSWAFVQLGLPFMFVDQRIADWPANHIEAALAHELAHYYHFATNSLAHDKDAEEKQVDWRISRWGYDVLRLWAYEALSIRDNQAPTSELIEEFLEECRQKHEGTVRDPSRPLGLPPRGQAGSACK